MDKTKGFSLVELLIVIIILATLTTMTVLYLAPQRRQLKADDAARAFYNTARQARILSITRRIYYAVVINTAETEQNLTLSNSTISLKFPGNSVSLVDMGSLSSQTDERIQNVSIYPRDVTINPIKTDYFIPDKTAKFPPLERTFTDDIFSSNTYVFYFDPAGRALNGATESANQLYRTFYFCPQKESNSNAQGMNALTRAITLYGATGGVSFWRYEQNQWKNNRQ